MKVLILFNSYMYKGGEASVALSESQLLLKHNHKVIFENWDNSAVMKLPFYKKISLAWTPVWSFYSYKKVLNLIRKEKPNIVHVQNFFPLISPSIFYACSKENVPVVFTLHNYRILCANGIFFRNGTICKECLQRGTLHGLKYGCYRDSRLQTIPVFLMQLFHKFLSTWQKKVDL